MKHTRDNKHISLPYDESNTPQKRNFPIIIKKYYKGSPEKIIMNLLFMAIHNLTDKKELCCFS